jgi:hypothetical protein
MLSLRGRGVTEFWPVAQGSYTEDDVRIDPSLGVAVVAAGRGVIGEQGRPASTIALWSLLGELMAGGDLARGFARAHAAVRRLTWAWASGLRKPWAMMAALQIVGDDRAVVAHTGTCRVSRITSDGLIPITTDHRFAGKFASHVLGMGDAFHELTELSVTAGDRFLLADNHLHELLDERAIAASCSTADALCARMIDSRHHGAASFALVEVVDRSRLDAPSGTSSEPPRSWLYAPGEPLPDPPPAWREGIERNPFPEWFDEVWPLVIPRPDTE